MGGRCYIAIDAKSFYASVELADRGLDPLTVNLVVADPSRTEKTICLAVSPSLKALGIPGRARLFEVREKVGRVNAERFRTAMRRGLLPRDPETGRYRFSGSSFDAPSLEKDPSLELTYITAPPRMLLYEQVSARIFSIYSGYVSPEDIHVYSIDEVFLDVTAYLKTYGVTARELAGRMIRHVLRETGITAAAGIGTNLYLAKAAMDIMAKRVPPDRDGVRIAELDEMTYREKLWCHTPLTDFWRVGRGTAARLRKLNCLTMGDVARQSVRDESVLYRAFGVNAELLIDHAWGWEPAEISAVKAYRPETNSLSSGQILAEPYDFEKGRLIVKEMAESMAMDLVSKGLVTRQMALTVDYDRTSITLDRQGRTAKETVYRVTKTGQPYQGTVGTDWYGRPAPKHAHGSENMDRWTSAASAVRAAVLAVYDRTVDRDLTVRRVTVAACGVIPEDRIPQDKPEQLSLLVDYDALERERKERQAAEDKERRLQKAALAIRGRFGKNAVLKGMDLLEGGTARERNGQIGGHRAGTADLSPAGDAEKTPEGGGRHD